MKLSILVPVYNERYLVRECLRRVLAAPLPKNLEREIIVVDDGSTDGTSEVLKEIAAANSDTVTLHEHKRNQGKGAALRTAINAATGDFLLIQDADLEYNPSDYPALLGPLLDGEADAVFGTRFQGGPKKRVMLFWHAVANKALTFMCNMFTDLDLTDLWTCYKVFRAPFVKGLPIRCDGFCVDVEITAKLAKQRCRIYEVPISYAGRTYDEGKKIGFFDAVRSIGVIIGFWLVDDLYGKDKLVQQALHALERAARFNDWMADTIRPYVGTRVLEIGAGTGNLTAKLCQRDSYTASDVDDFYCQHLSRRFSNRPGVSISKIDLARREDFAPLRAAVDTVVCLNVLEHVEDDKTALDNLRSALTPGGRLILLVPNLPWAYGSIDRLAGHRRRYEKEGLSALLKKADFTVDKMIDFNRISLPAWIWNGKVLKRESFGGVQLTLFDSLVWFFRRIDRFLPWPPQSLIAIARKAG